MGDGSTVILSNKHQLWKQRETHYHIEDAASGVKNCALPIPITRYSYWNMCSIIAPWCWKWCAQNKQKWMCFNFRHLHIRRHGMSEKASEVYVRNSVPLHETYGEAQVVHQQFSTLSLRGGEWSPSHPLGPTPAKYLYEFQNSCYIVTLVFIISFFIQHICNSTLLLLQVFILPLQSCHLFLYILTF